MSNLFRHQSWCFNRRGNAVVGFSFILWKTFKKVFFVDRFYISDSKELGRGLKRRLIQWVFCCAGDRLFSGQVSTGKISSADCFSLNLNFGWTEEFGESRKECQQCEPRSMAEWQVPKSYKYCEKYRSKVIIRWSNGPPISDIGTRPHINGTR